MPALQLRTIIVRAADRVRGFLRQARGRSTREIASARERSKAGTFIVVSTVIVASENRTAAFGQALQRFAPASQKRTGRLGFKPTGRILAPPRARY